MGSGIVKILLGGSDWLRRIGAAGGRRAVGGALVVVAQGESALLGQGQGAREVGQAGLDLLQAALERLVRAGAVTGQLRQMWLGIAQQPPEHGGRGRRGGAVAAI